MRAIRAKLKISLPAHGWRRQETDRFFGTCGWKESRPHQDGALDFLRVERKTFWMEESMTKECTLATMQPWIPCFPSIPGTMQTSPPPSNAGLDLAAVSHTRTSSFRPTTQVCVATTCDVFRLLRRGSIDEHASCERDSSHVALPPGKGRIWHVWCGGLRPRARRWTWWLACSTSFAKVAPVQGSRLAHVFEACDVGGRWSMGRSKGRRT